MGNLSSTELKRLHREWRRKNEASVSLAFEGVQGPFNIGSAIRTAAAYRATDLLLSKDATGPENSKVGKTALGTDRYLNVERFVDTPELIAHAKSKGFTVVGVELAHDATPIGETDLRGNVCLLLGNEDRGLSAAALEQVDRCVFIPQFGKVGSLNVATAASIALYEWARQQLAPDAPTNA